MTQARSGKNTPPAQFVQRHILMLTDVQNPDRCFRTQFTQDLTVGRSKRCDMVIDDPTLARKHCAFLTEYGVYYVRGLQRHRPIVVNGQRQLPKVNTVVVTGSLVALGRHLYRVQLQSI